MKEKCGICKGTDIYLDSTEDYWYCSDCDQFTFLLEDDNNDKKN